MPKVIPAWLPARVHDRLPVSVFVKFAHGQHLVHSSWDLPDSARITTTNYPTSGADVENRTLVNSLEGCLSAFEHPRVLVAVAIYEHPRGVEPPFSA